MCWFANCLDQLASRLLKNIQIIVLGVLSRTNQLSSLGPLVGCGGALVLPIPHLLSQVYNRGCAPYILLLYTLVQQATCNIGLLL